MTVAHCARGAILSLLFAFGVAAASAPEIEHSGVPGLAVVDAGGVPDGAHVRTGDPVIVPRMPRVKPTQRSPRFAVAPPAHTAIGASSQPKAPPLAANFSGIPYTGFFPPDPIIAAGPTHLVAVVNGGIALFAKDGTKTQQRALDAFHNGARSADGFTYDPKIIYDPHGDRFVVITLDGQSSPDSWLRIAVSKSSTPSNLSVGSSASQDWWGYTIDADKDGGVQTNDNWADFPGLGVDQFNVYITTNMFSNAGDFEYAKVWVIAKASLYAGNPITPLEFGAPPAAPLGNPVTGLADFTIAPEINFDATSEHLLATNALDLDGNGYLTLWTVNNPATAPTLESANLTVTGWNDDNVPQCPQSGGGAPLDDGDTRVLHVVERNGSLWATHTQSSVDNARAEARWYELDPATPAVRQLGAVGDPTRCYFYPAIQPDAHGNVCLVMSGVDGSIFGSAFYTGRAASDPPGTMQPVGSLQAGWSNYVVTAEGSNRWGDFGGIAADPVTDDIWMFHEYAAATADQWRTWIGRKQAPTSAPTNPTSSTATPTPTASATATVSPTRSPSVTLTTSATPTPTRTITASITILATNTPTRTQTATASATIAGSTTRTPDGPRGDVNCDGYVSAADVIALQPLIPPNDVGPCGRGDVNEDDVVNSADIAAAIERIFTTP